MEWHDVATREEAWEVPPPHVGLHARVARYPYEKL